jgi:hypothetical protein
VTVEKSEPRGIASNLGATNATVTGGTVAGFATVVLENPRVRAVLVPELGGRVWELLDRVHQRQWIWHREDVPLVAAPPGSSYDDVWAGGWEELFPNDAAGTFEGRTLLDHGEWWTTKWSVAHSSSGEEAVVRLVADSPIGGAWCSKEYRLASDGNTVEVSYRIEARETGAFHFLFKQHLPIAITPACRLVLPGGRVVAVDPSFGTLLPGPGPFEWPLAGAVDLQAIPERSAAAREFVYVTDLPDGWCGVDDQATGASLRMRYDTRHLPYMWLFLSYGGWRDCYTAVLEPCSNMPKDLAEAVRTGRSARLAAGGIFQTSVSVTLGATTGTPERGRSA